MDLDIANEIEWEAERQFSFQQDMYDFDLSDIQVEIASFQVVGSPSVRPKRLKVIDTIDRDNCTSSPQTENYPEYSEQHTESFTVTFGGKIGWGTSVTGSFEIPGGLTVGGSRTQSVELTANTSYTQTNTTTVRHVGSPVIIPPCKRVRAPRELWVTEIAGTVRVRVRIHGRVSYKVSIDLWPDPEYSMDLDFTTTIDGQFSGVSGYEVRGRYQESPARNCQPPCRVQTAGACRVLLGETRVASASHVVTGLGFRTKVALEGVPGARLDEPFAFEENPETPLVLQVAVIPGLETFQEIVGRTRVEVPLVGQPGAQKLDVPVLCRIPGEVLGIDADVVTVTVVQPVKLAMLEA